MPTYPVKMILGSEKASTQIVPFSLKTEQRSLQRKMTRENKENNDTNAIGLTGLKDQLKGLSLEPR